MKYKLVCIEGEETKVLSEHPTWKQASRELDRVLSGRVQGEFTSSAGVVEGEDLKTAKLIELYQRV